MKISSSFENINSNKYCQSFGGIPENPKYIPGIIGKAGKIAGEYVNTPEQKMFLAISALMFHPLIDLKCADEDKKVDSAIKSASKAMAGGLTGVTIRALFLKLTDHFIGFDKNNRLNAHFFPDVALKMKEESPALADVRMKQYCQTLGTLFAVIFMILFSNSKVDVPLTSDLQDLISGVVKEDKSLIKSLSDVQKARKNKMKNWFTRKKNKIKNIINVLRDKPVETEKSKPEKEISK